MAGNINEYFSLVFNLEDISSLPASETKFEGRKSDYFVQLIITPKIVTTKIRDMRVILTCRGCIPSKLLLQSVRKMSITLAKVLNLSLEEGVVMLQWKEASIMPIFKTKFKKQVTEL